jgi:hypothetical protein
VKVAKKKRKKMKQIKKKHSRIKKNQNLNVKVPQNIEKKMKIMEKIYLMTMNKNRMKNRLLLMIQMRKLKTKLDPMMITIKQIVVLKKILENKRKSEHIMMKLNRKL